MNVHTLKRPAIAAAEGWLTVAALASVAVVLSIISVTVYVGLLVGAVIGSSAAFVALSVDQTVRRRGV